MIKDFKEYSSETKMIVVSLVFIGMSISWIMFKEIKFVLLVVLISIFLILYTNIQITKLKSIEYDKKKLIQLMFALPITLTPIFYPAYLFFFGFISPGVPWTCSSLTIRCINTRFINSGRSLSFFLILLVIVALSVFYRGVMLLQERFMFKRLDEFIIAKWVIIYSLICTSFLFIWLLGLDFLLYPQYFELNLQVFIKDFAFIYAFVLGAFILVKTYHVIVDIDSKKVIPEITNDGEFY